MSYFDAYKKRLKVDNISDSFKLDTIDNTIREFKNNPSYKSATLIDYNLDETPIDIRIVNEDKSPSYKRFHFLPETEVNIGSYIKFDDKYYLVKEYEYNIMSPFAKVVFCNQTINFADGTSLPCTAEGESYGVKMTATNDILLETDTKVKCTVGRNILSEKIEPDFRIIFEHSKQGIYKAGDTTHYIKGLITLTCKKDKYYENLDDLKNNIAWQFDYDYDAPSKNYNIIGLDTIRVNEYFEYKLEPNANCIFIVDGDEVDYENTSQGIIRIRCAKANELIKLKATINGKIVCSKNIITIS